MKFFIDNWFLFLAAASSGALLIWPMLNKGAGGTGKVSASAAVQLINRERAVLIDVSEPAEYAAGHAVGAKSVPLASLEASNDLPKNKALPLVVLCPTGSRASRAVATLKKLGFEKPQALAGGLAAWREANLPVEKDRMTGVPGMQAVKIYLTQGCPYCVQAKALLKQRGVEQIDEVRVDLEPAERSTMLQLTGRRTVPQIFIGATHVGGCDDLVELDRRGELLPLLTGG